MLNADYAFIILYPLIKNGITRHNARDLPGYRVPDSSERQTVLCFEDTIEFNLIWKNDALKVHHFPFPALFSFFHFFIFSYQSPHHQEAGRVIYQSNIQ